MIHNSSVPKGSPQNHDDEIDLGRVRTSKGTILEGNECFIQNDDYDPANPLQQGKKKLTRSSIRPIGKAQRESEAGASVKSTESKKMKAGPLEKLGKRLKKAKNTIPAAQPKVDLYSSDTRGKAEDCTDDAGRHLSSDSSSLHDNISMKSPSRWHIHEDCHARLQC